MAYPENMDLSPSFPPRERLRRQYRCGKWPMQAKGGMPTHPLWYRNLEADPACELMVGSKRVLARARVAEGEERERLWQQMAEIYPPYLDYQKATERTIPVVVLEPVA